MKLSVVLTTYNRFRDLRRLLESLEKSRDVDESEWELVVVDNNSTDETCRVLHEFRTRGRLPLRDFFEARQGKSFALNTGLAAVTGRIIAFVDDDIIVPPTWLRQIIEYFEAHREAVCAGGMVRLHDPGDAPLSTRTSAEPARVGIADFSAVTIPIMGCNMAMRATLLQAVGPLDTDLGPGSRIGVADDLDLLYRVVRGGHSIDYVPHILVFHNHGRREEKDIQRTRANYLAGRGAFYCKYLLEGDRTVTRWAYWECRLLGWNWLRAPFGKTARRDGVDLWFLLLGAVRYLRYRDHHKHEPSRGSSLVGPNVPQQSNDRR